MNFDINKIHRSKQHLQIWKLPSVSGSRTTVISWIWNKYDNILIKIW